MYDQVCFWPQIGINIPNTKRRALTAPGLARYYGPMKKRSLGQCARLMAAIAVVALLGGALLPPAQADDAAYTATVRGGALRLREKPSDAGRVLGRYHSGTVVTVLADGEGFCRVRTPDGLEGYMMKEFLAFYNGLPPADKAAEAEDDPEPPDEAHEAREAALARGVDPTRPMLALTFDDGPSPATEAILDQLKIHGAKATFFILGQNIAGNEAIMKRAAEEGHQLASHSWSHPNLDDLSSSAVRSQMTRTMNKVEEITGQSVFMMRPPYGTSNRLTRRVMSELGLPVILWGVDSLDWKTRSASKISRAITKGAGNGVIILCHDTLQSTGWALETALPELAAQGYQLVTVAEMMSFRDEEPKAGWEYNRLDPSRIAALVP